MLLLSYQCYLPRTATQHLRIWPFGLSRPLCYFRELLFTTRDASNYPSDSIISLIPCLAPQARPSLAMPHDGPRAIALSDAYPLHVHACTKFAHRTRGKACRSSEGWQL